MVERRVSLPIQVVVSWVVTVRGRIQVFRRTMLLPSSVLEVGVKLPWFRPQKYLVNESLSTVNIQDRIIQHCSKKCVNGAEIM